MDYKIIINPEKSSNDKINNYNIQISNLLSDKLNSIGINNIVINNNYSDEEKINFINNNSNNKTLVITNGLSNESGIEIIYPLRSTDVLALRLINNFEDNNFKINKYYQRRATMDTSKDYDLILRDINNDGVIIRYGDINTDNTYLNGRIDDLVSVVANTLKSYLGLSNDYYIVKKGDNLYSIARQFNTTVDTIKKLNNLTSNKLDIGQRLIIKSIPSTIDDDKDYYIVKKGDTLYGIAIKNGITVDELKRINSLNTNNLSIGQRVIIKGNKDNTYIVKNGDTLYSIAHKYGISVNELKEVNNLTTNNLSIGQKLIIPKDNIIEYTVQKGDNLYSIANKYKVSIKDIMNINNLKSTNLAINQILLIPSSN